MARRKRTTIKDVASAAGVSHPTASRILNNKLENYPLRKETIERVRQAAKDLRYRPNHFAQSLKTQSSKIIGLSVPGMPPPQIGEDAWTEEMVWAERPNTWVDMLFGAAYCNWLHKRHFALLERNIEDSQSTMLDDILPSYVDGALIATPGAVLFEENSVLNDEDRVVALGTPPRPCRFSTCDVNNRKASMEITRELVAAGARKIMYVYDMPPQQHVATEIFEGFRDVLHENGIEVVPDICFRNYRAFPDSSNLVAWIAERLREKDKVDAILIAAWTSLQHVMEGIQESGRKYPNDLLVAGIASCGFSPADVRGLTAVHLPIADIAYKATALLIDQIDGKSEGYRHIEIPHTLVRRTSTGEGAVAVP